MFVSQELRKKNIAEYLLYMWQVEDLIRAYDCSLSRIRREYIERFDYTDEQKEEMTDWYGDLLRMMNQEGCREGGHLQINQIVLQQLVELNAQLLSSSKFPFYNSEYYKVLPFIVELRQKTGDRRQETGDRRRETGDGRRETGGRRQEMGDRRQETGDRRQESEIETCFNGLYGVMMLRLQKKEISQNTLHAIKEITTFIGMLSDYYQKDKNEGLEFE